MRRRNRRGAGHPARPEQLIFASQLTAIRFFTASGPITGFPTRPLVPGDRIIGQDRILQNGRAAGHDNEACTVSFDRDVLCQDIVILDGQGDLQTSWTFQWPATGTWGPASFDGVIGGGTAHFAAAHGTFHAATPPDGYMQITAVIDAGQRRRARRPPLRGVQLIEAGIELALAAAAARNLRARKQGMTVHVQPSNQDLGGVVRSRRRRHAHRAHPDPLPRARR